MEPNVAQPQFEKSSRVFSLCGYLEGFFSVSALFDWWRERFSSFSSHVGTRWLPNEVQLLNIYVDFNISQLQKIISLPNNSAMSSLPPNFDNFQTYCSVSLILINFHTSDSALEFLPLIREGHHR